MQKQISITLFLVLCLPQVLVCLWLETAVSCHRQSVKASMQSAAEKKEMVLLRMDPEMQAAVEWKDEREFAFSGMMYDVVRKAVCADTLFIWCYPDRRETALRALQQASFPGNRESDASLALHDIFHFFKTVYLPVVTGWDCIALPAARTGFPLKGEALVSLPQAVIKPPPR